MIKLHLLNGDVLLVNPDTISRVEHRRANCKLFMTTPEEISVKESLEEVYALIQEDRDYPPIALTYEPREIPPVFDVNNLPLPIKPEGWDFTSPMSKRTEALKKNAARWIALQNMVDIAFRGNLEFWTFDPIERKHSETFAESVDREIAAKSSKGS